MKDENKLDKTLQDIEIEELLDSVKNGKVSSFQNPLQAENSPVIKKPEEHIEEKENNNDEAPVSKKKEKSVKTGGFAKKIRALPKSAVIAFLAVVLFVVAAIVTLSVVHHSRTAYLKPYESTYGIEFPKGIAEEFCDEYGRNQNLEGRLTITDTDSEIMVSNSIEVIIPHADIGTELLSQQQFKSIHLDKKYADLESAFADSTKFTGLTQEVKFTDIYGNTSVYQVLGAYYVTTRPQDDKDYLFMYNLYGDLTEDSFDDYKDRINSRLLYRTGYNLSYFDKFLTLSVESDFMTGFRFVVLCRQVEDGFSPFTEVEVNKKVHYPQVWYDVNKKENPYRFAAKWYPEIYTDAEHKTVMSLK